MLDDRSITPECLPTVAQETRSEDLYATFNLLMRRKPKVCKANSLPVVKQIFSLVCFLKDPGGMP